MMTKPEFNKRFKAIFGHYPSFSLSREGYQECSDIYFDSLKYFPLDVVSLAIQRAIKLTPQFFPPLGLIRNCCETITNERESENKYPHVKFWPHDHGCGLDKKRADYPRARGLLLEISPYEAVHVYCRSDKAPRCPNCGADVPAFDNPFILALMKRYPEDTRRWNAQHKGNLLCDRCERIDYPKGFIATQPQLVGGLEQ